ncbi:MAG TPA: hypothetical protein VF799_05275 [Geobacteraceae bacterium]
MTVHMAGGEAHLVGDWTLSGLTGNIDSLTLSLHQLELGRGKNLQINCGQLRKADRCGLELLNVWIQCARLRGAEPVLVNVPESLSQTMHALIGQRSPDNSRTP